MESVDEVAAVPVEEVSTVPVQEAEVLGKVEEGGKKPRKKREKKDPAEPRKKKAKTEEEEEEEEEEEYEVECILEERKKGRKTEYLVKWKGYDNVEDITWEPKTALKDTAALEAYLRPTLDIMGNQWILNEESVSVRPAGAEESVTVPTPAPPSALATCFGGYVWLVAAGQLYRLDPRGPGYTDDGLAKRDEPGDHPIGCVGAYLGDRQSHMQWREVELPEPAIGLQPPRASDHVIVTMREAGAQEVALGADGEVRLAPPSLVPSSGAWRTLPSVLPCANHDISAAVIGDHIYTVGGALWWRGFPAREHMFDEVWRMDVRKKERVDAWEVVARTPHKIAFAGLAALDGILYIFGGCRNRNEVPNDRTDERQLWVYDPATASISVGPDMLVARQECAGASLNGRIYAFGWDKSCESFAPGETAWRQEADCPVVLGGGNGMAGQFNVTTLDGTAYVAGPFGLLSFRPQHGWATLPGFGKPLGGCPLVAAHQKEVWVMSGFFYDPTPGQMCDLKREVHSYDPSTHQWRERPPLPCCEAWGAGASVGGTLYAIGGSKFSRDAKTFCFDNRVFVLEAGAPYKQGDCVVHTTGWRGEIVGMIRKGQQHYYDVKFANGQPGKKIPANHLKPAPLEVPQPAPLEGVVAQAVVAQAVVAQATPMAASN